MSRLGARALLVSALLAGTSCAPADPRRVVAEEFIDRLFVVIDQVSARELAVGLARAKIDEEIRLKGDQAIDEATRQPRVHYDFVQLAGAEGDDTTSLVYQLSIAPDGTESFTRRLILTVRHSAEGWRVANYTLESPPAPD
jgi:hypothetical protein